MSASGMRFHALRTRCAGARSFVSLHVLVPGAWTVQRGHDVLEEIERLFAQPYRAPVSLRIWSLSRIPQPGKTTRWSARMKRLALNAIELQFQIGRSRRHAKEKYFRPRHVPFGDLR